MMRVVFIKVWTSSIRLDYNAEQNGERTGTAHQSHPLVGLSYLQRGGGAHLRGTITGHRAEKREHLVNYRRQRRASERKVNLAARDKGSVKAHSVGNEHVSIVKHALYAVRSLAYIT